MRISLRGWSRDTLHHMHRLLPVEMSPEHTYVPDISVHKDALGEDVPAPLQWTSQFGKFAALGKIHGLALSGDFLVKFELSETELENWLRCYVQYFPKKANRLMAEMQAEATLEMIVQEQSD